MLDILRHTLVRHSCKVAATQNLIKPDSDRQDEAFCNF